MLSGLSIGSGIDRRPAVSSGCAARLEPSRGTRPKRGLTFPGSSFQSYGYHVFAEGVCGRHWKPLWRVLSRLSVVFGIDLPVLRFPVAVPHALRDWGWGVLLFLAAAGEGSGGAGGESQKSQTRWFWDRRCTARST